MLYIVTGLPYAGKTTLTNKLVERFGYEVVSVDEQIDQGNYIVEKMTQDDWNVVYSKAFDKLKRLLTESKTVIFDGGSLKRSERNTLREIAEGLNNESRLIYVKIPKREITQRWLKNQTTKERDHLEEQPLNFAFDLFEEPTDDEQPIIYNQNLDLDQWISEIFFNTNLQ